MGLLDLIFPKTCSSCGKVGNYLCENCFNKVEFLKNQFCPECKKPAISGKSHPKCHSKLGLDGLVSIVYYTDPITKVLTSIKYRLASSMVNEIAAKLAPKQANFDRDTKFLPLPLFHSRQNFRGFNQAELFANFYAQKFGKEIETKLLLKVKSTKPQVGLKREERLKNLENAFSVNGNVENQSFVVVDDVWTTGTTLKTAAKVLKKAGAREVWGFTIARSR